MRRGAVSHIDGTIPAWGIMNPEEGSLREETEEAARYIELRYFHTMLALTTRTQDPFELLTWFIEQGLRITVEQRPDHPISPDVLNDALAKVRAASDIDPDDPRGKWRSWMIPIPAESLPPPPEDDPLWERLTAKWRNGVGWLYVGREDYERVCARLKVSEYYWPLHPWPESERDLHNYPVSSGSLAATPTAKSAATPTKRRRRTRIRIAVEAARAALLARLGQEPSTGEVFSYLADRDETNVIVDYSGDKLVWSDTRGKFHDTTRKALANLLSRIRNAL